MKRLTAEREKEISQDYEAWSYAPGCHHAIPELLEEIETLRSENETFLEYGRSESDVVLFHDMGNRIADLEIKHDKLLEEIKALRTALEFYADEDNWDDDPFSPTVWNDGLTDLGNVAREALKGNK